MYNDRLSNAQRALKAAELDKARLQEALDRVTRHIAEEAPELYDTISERFLSDLQTTEEWLVREVAPVTPGEKALAHLLD